MSQIERVLSTENQKLLVEILFMFSFGVAKGKQTPIWQSEKRSTLRPENEFFKSNMDALTVLAIWDTGHG